MLSRHAEKLVVVIAGSINGTTSVLGSLPHGRWHCWRRLQLKDFDDAQLRIILLRLISRNRLKVDGGNDSPYPQIAAKRVGRGRDSTGFGNIHDLQLAFEKMLERQAYRLERERLAQEGSEAKYATLTMEDIVGPEPGDIRSESQAWKDLEKMAGLKDVKKAIGALLNRARANYRREINGKEPLQTSLNRVFLGPPGTGKTTVAKLYGKIVAELGLLSTKEVVFTTPGDYIGQYIGESEVKTAAILNSTVGKVLVIDDAHMFYNGKDTDEFRLGCIDVLISRIHNKPGEDRCVILIGYPDNMEEMFQKCNPGLKRRFPLEEAFRFQDYNDDQLNEILMLKMAKEEITADKQAMGVAAEVLSRARDRPNFGNGGEVDNLLNQAKARFRERMLKKDKKDNDDEKAPEDNEDSQPREDIYDDEAPHVVLEPEDFDPEWDRGAKAGSKSSLFSGLLGFEDITKRFEEYQVTAANMRRFGKDPKQNIPFTFVFKGPPGTGKTHTARIIGQIFYRLGFLSTDEVIECSASHLIGQYMGQTAPKVIDLFDRALGKVLFIDEAYRLAGGAGSIRGGQSYEDEAIGELVDCMTKPRYMRKMVIVLAGYDRDMDKLLRANAGLRGRFPNEITFPPLDPERCREHLVNLLLKQDIEIRDETTPSIDELEKVLRLFDKLRMTTGWSNGRDVRSLAETITAYVYKSIDLPEDDNGKNKSVGKAVTVRSVKGESDGKTAQFGISTPKLIGFLKDLLRQRIKGGGPK
ncbi:P-loop containing nucleoside triphosphate hydrolase protein [Thozetella sp. PMI_491]|nr:P-loop containing nucleoside triphosphate hydrolase protein [Thozetella sp. PMI_491]